MKDVLGEAMVAERGGGGPGKGVYECNSGGVVGGVVWVGWVG